MSSVNGIWSLFPSLPQSPSRDLSLWSFNDWFWFFSLRIKAGVTYCNYVNYTVFGPLFLRGLFFLNYRRTVCTVMTEICICSLTCNSDLSQHMFVPCSNRIMSWHNRKSHVFNACIMHLSTVGNEDRYLCTDLSVSTTYRVFYLFRDPCFALTTNLMSLCESETVMWKYWFSIWGNAITFHFSSNTLISLMLLFHYLEFILFSVLYSFRVY